MSHSFRSSLCILAGQLSQSSSDSPIKVLSRYSLGEIVVNLAEFKKPLISKSPARPIVHRSFKRMRQMCRHPTDALKMSNSMLCFSNGGRLWVFQRNGTCFTSCSIRTPSSQVPNGCQSFVKASTIFPFQLPSSCSKTIWDLHSTAIVTPNKDSPPHIESTQCPPPTPPPPHPGNSYRHLLLPSIIASRPHHGGPLRLACTPRAGGE